MALHLKCFPIIEDLESTDNAPQEKGVDECDELPQSLEIANIDIFFAIFSIVTYVLDFITDAALAVSLIINGNNLHGVLILFFAIVPQCIINVVSLHWIYEDGDRVDVGLRRRINEREEEGRLNKCPCAAFPDEGVLATISRFFFQAGPLWWHTKYISNALLSRTMLESLPQLVIQLTLFSYGIWDTWNDKAFQVNYSFLISSFISLLSISWSFAAQHRSSRMAHPLKINLHPIEMLLIVLWRFFTTASRILLLIIGWMYFRMYFLIFIAIHVLLSAYHIKVMQLPYFGEGLHSVKCTLVFLISLVHIFFPFNMVEGETQLRYLTAYTIELAEAGLIYYATLRNDAFEFPLKLQYSIFTSVSMLIGIFTMIFYYTNFHPNRRLSKRLNKPTINVEVECVNSINKRNELNEVNEVGETIENKQTKDSTEICEK